MNPALLICPAGLINKDQPHKLGGHFEKLFRVRGAGLAQIPSKIEIFYHSTN